MRSDAEWWEVASRPGVCTPKELEALDLRRRRGFSEREVALTLGVSRTSIRDRIENADRKIELALRQNVDDGSEAA